jgi:hypothetical protein
MDGHRETLGDTHNATLGCDVGYLAVHESYQHSTAGGDEAPVHVPGLRSHGLRGLAQHIWQ